MCYVSSVRSLFNKNFSEKKDEVKWKSVFKSAENRAAISLHKGRRSSLHEDFVSVKNPMGILVVWSLKKISTKFSILSDLLRNLNLTKIKLCSFFPAQQLTYMKNYFDTIEELSIGSHLKKINNWCQNPYGCKTNYKFIFGPFFSQSQLCVQFLPTSFRMLLKT